MGVEMRSRPTGEAVIDAVVPGSPADVGGLRPGDVILGIDNTSVTSTADVTAALSRLRPGQVVPVSASRGTAGFTAQVTLAARPRGYAMP
jgi:serine protease DegQ